jgi:hypothetical protein
MSISLADAEAQLSAWVAANLATAKGQSYSIGNRSLTRVDSSDILEQIDYWSGVVASLKRSAAGQSRNGFKLPNWN